MKSGFHRKGNNSGQGLLSTLFASDACYTVSVSEGDVGVWNTQFSAAKEKTIIISLQQDGKTAEDLAKSEQHEHVAGLLTRLRKVRNCLCSEMLCAFYQLQHQSFQ